MVPRVLREVPTPTAHLTATDTFASSIAIFETTSPIHRNRSPNTSRQLFESYVSDSKRSPQWNRSIRLQNPQQPVSLSAGSMAFSSTTSSVTVRCWWSKTASFSRRSPTGESNHLRKQPNRKCVDSNTKAGPWLRPANRHYRSFVENRRRKNTKDAYWALSFDPKAAEQGLTGQSTSRPRPFSFRMASPDSSTLTMCTLTGKVRSRSSRNKELSRPWKRFERLNESIRTLTITSD